MEMFSEYKPYLIGAVFTIVTGLILWLVQWRMQRDKLKLIYSLKKSASFPSGEHIGQAYTVILVNKGNKAILDCKFWLRFAASKIDSYKFTNERLIENLEGSDKAIECFIPLLNPKEQLELTVTCKSSGDAVDMSSY